MLFFFRHNPEVDLRKCLFRYGLYYDHYKPAESKKRKKTGVDSRIRSRPFDFAWILKEGTTEVSTICPLSAEASEMLGAEISAETSSEPQPVVTVSALLRVLTKGTIIVTGNIGSTIVKCSETIVCKVRGGSPPCDPNEHKALQYLEQHLPGFPAPKPHGFLKTDKATFLFTSYIPSTTLREVWLDLSATQKISVQQQLNDHFARLRTLQQDDGKPLGGVDGGPVKDHSRFDRVSDEVIDTVSKFDEFLFRRPEHVSQTYAQFLLKLLPALPKRSVFTHGDVRTPNILVDVDGTESCTVTGIVDWEYIGFYPEYYEAAKMTNCISRVREDDWYLHLPPCIAPESYSTYWLLSRVWEIIGQLDAHERSEASKKP